MNNWNALILGAVIGYLFKLLFNNDHTKGNRGIMEIPSVDLVRIGRPAVNDCRVSGSTKTSS